MVCWCWGIAWWGREEVAAGSVTKVLLLHWRLCVKFGVRVQCLDLKALACSGTIMDMGLVIAVPSRLVLWNVIRTVVSLGRAICVYQIIVMGFSCRVQRIKKKCFAGVYWMLLVLKGRSRALKGFLAAADLFLVTFQSNCSKSFKWDVFFFSTRGASALCIPINLSFSLFFSAGDVKCVLVCDVSMEVFIRNRQWFASTFCACKLSQCIWTSV